MTTTPEANPSKHQRTGRNLPVAVGVGLGLVACIALTLWIFHWGFVLIEAVAFSLAAVEIHNAAKHKGMRSSLVPVVVGSVLLVVSPWANTQLIKAGIHTGLESGSVILAMLALSVTAVLVWRMPRGPENYVRDVSAGLLTIAYVPLLGSCVTLMFADTHGTQRVLMYVLTVAAADTGGYTVGVLFGKHKMLPVISPKKTWEGLAGTFILAIATAILLGRWLLGVPWWGGLLFGIVITLFAVAGDLVASMIKRDAGIKDMSNFIPGHGGLMDRLDSLLVAAPPAWLLLSLLVA